MKRLLLTCIVIFTIIFGSSCADRPANGNVLALYNGKEYSLKKHPDITTLGYNDLKEHGFRMVADDTVPPFPIDDPNTSSIYPTSDTGHTSTSPFYIHNYGRVEDTNQHTALCWWRPVEGDAGIYNIKITASDGQLKDSQVVKITVLEGNKPPIIFAKYEKGKIANVHSESQILRRF